MNPSWSRAFVNKGVFRAAPAGIAVSRDSRCERVEVNAAFAGILGIREGINASLTGADADNLPFRVTDEEGRPIAAGDLALQVAARTGQTVTRTLIVERDGGARIISGTAVPVQQAGGGDRGAIAVFVDVTGERRSAAEREELLAAAEAARLEAEAATRAKDDFLAVLSHELRSPLNAMLGWLQIMKRPGADERLFSRAVETLERNTRAQTQIINDLLDISRIRSGKFELDRGRVDLTAVIVASVESLRPMAQGKALQLELSLPEGPLHVDGDMVRLQQVITNVVHNAIKFTSEGGRVWVTVAKRELEVDIRIEDTGQGIEQTLLPHIFERFVQSESATTRRHGGLGLGLAIVKQLIERHGGTVHARSEGVGQGAVFTMTLPAAPPHSEEPLGPILRSVPSDGSIEALDVLVVEDDDDSRDAMQMTLERAGARVRVARSVREALRAYADGPPDVLVSDIGMPGEDGYTLIGAIRDREDGTTRRTLAIAISGFATRGDHETALRAGFDDHLGKPVEPAALVQCVRVLAAARPSTTS
jgi:signal transduction histidine kinase/CheY-like chemotaxis protein